MGITVQFAIEGKRRNSTKLPTAGMPYVCDFKYPTSIENPVLLLHEPAGSTNPAQYSLATIPELNRNYRVIEAISISATQWEMHLQVDVLATYRPVILASKAFVLRASTAYNDDLIDNMLPTTVSQESETDQLDFISMGDGAYVLTVIGGATAAGIGGAAQYVLSEQQAKSLTEKLSDQSLLEEVSKYFANPYDSIISLIWQPVAASGASASIKIGEYDTGISGNVVPSTPVVFETILTAELPYSDYRRKTQTEITLHLPGVGAVDIDPTILVYRQTPQPGGLLPPIPRGFSIRITAHYDVSTGDVHYKVVEPNSQSLILLADGNLAVQLVTGVRSSNIGQALTALAMGAGAAIGIVGSIGVASALDLSVGTTARYAAGLGGSTVGMVANGLIQMNRQTPHITGHVGGKAAVQDNKMLYLTIRARSVSQEPVSAAPTIGLPVYRVENLAAFTDQFVICSYWSEKCDATKMEMDMLNELMNGSAGIYLE